MQQVIATTQMQSTDCRRAFPCWDEPEFKAVFGVTLDVESEASPRSPTAPRSSGATVDGRTVIRFADTMVMSSYLVAFVVGRLETSDTDRRQRHPAAHRARARQGPPHRVRARRRCIQPALVRGVLRHQVPERQGRPRRAARLLGRRDGEPRLHHVPREPAAARPGHQHPERARGRRRRRVARTGPHVVRRPGDDALVERDLVERGVRHVHGDRRLRRLPARLGSLDELRPGAHGRVRDRFPRQHPTGRVRGAVTRRLRRHVRRADLSEGRCPAAHARAVPRRRPLPRRREPLPPHAFVRQHRDERSVGRDRSDVRRAGAADHGLVDLAARLPDRQRLARPPPTTARRRCRCPSSGSGSPNRRARRRRSRSTRLGDPGAHPQRRRHHVGAPRRHHAGRAGHARRSRRAGHRQRRWPRLLPRRLRRRAARPDRRARCSRR